VLSGIVKQDKVHWLVRQVVVLEQSIISRLLKLVLVFDFLIDSVWHTK
jgi:hypothetical protein